MQAKAHYLLFASAAHIVKLKQYRKDGQSPGQDNIHIYEVFSIFSDMDIGNFISINAILFINEDMGKYVHCCVLYTYYI